MTLSQPDGEAVDAVDITTEPGSREGEWNVTVSGEIDVASSPHLRAELAAALEGGARTIVVNVEAMSFIDSSGLGVLVGALKRLREQDGDEIVVRGLQDPVRRVFEITGLTELFRVER